MRDQSTITPKTPFIKNGFKAYPLRQNFTIDITRKTPEPAFFTNRLRINFEKFSSIQSKSKLQQIIENSIQPSPFENKPNLLKNYGLEVRKRNMKPIESLKKAAPKSKLNMRRTQSSHHLLNILPIKPETPLTNLRAFSEEQRKIFSRDTQRNYITHAPLTDRNKILPETVDDKGLSEFYTCKMMENPPKNDIPEERRLQRRVTFKFTEEFKDGVILQNALNQPQSAAQRRLSMRKSRLSILQRKRSVKKIQLPTEVPQIKTPEELKHDLMIETIKYFIKARTRLEKLWFSIIKMRKMKLTPDILVKNHVFTKKPYEHELSEEFFVAVKLGEFAAVRRYLRINRYLVHDFDSCKQTALHWAAKRGYIDIVDLLIKTGCDVDAVDIMGRSALLFAAKGDFMDVVKLLICGQADPFQFSKHGETPHNLAKNHFIKLYIKKAQQVSVLMRWVSPVRKAELWDRWLEYIFCDPLCKPSEVVAQLAKNWAEKKEIPAAI